MPRVLIAPLVSEQFLPYAAIHLLASKLYLPGV
jgi:hypothetical protein